ncbi:hypothetical protein TPE_1138 [Treponema pedis str. T A4]|uniref:Uncharacterized protein n=1 Tax=Treponema pedis str. T A4 TaxID=1291379 RepID=S6A8D4_9SPIR|nr:hypothetical protein TPE_1138 [Treponema pedis str. T A4]
MLLYEFFRFRLKKYGKSIGMLKVSAPLCLKNMPLMNLL